MGTYIHGKIYLVDHEFNSDYKEVEGQGVS